MAAPSATARGASLRLWMDALMELEERVNEALPAGVRSLAMYRWRPNIIDAPALYHLITTAPAAMQDLVRLRDTPTIVSRIAVAYGDDASEMELIEQYIDVYRDVVDPALMDRSHPLEGAAMWADRTDMRLPVPEEFNGVPYLAVDFSIAVRLERFVTAT